jgi:hypothetical protein
MSYLMTPFEVACKTLAGPVRVRFVHLFPAIAIRHSDTMDCVFLVDGQHVTVAMSCLDLNRLREVEHKPLSDQQLVDIAATFLRRNLEHGYDPRVTELLLRGSQLTSIARELGFL